MSFNIAKGQFMKAFKNGDIEAIRLQIKNGLLENDIYDFLEDAIFDWGCEVNDRQFHNTDPIPEDKVVEIVSLLVDNGLVLDNPDRSDPELPNLLWSVLKFYCDSTKLVEYLISKGAELNTFDEHSSVLEDHRSYIELDARLGYPDLAKIKNNGCRLAISHGALPLSVLKLRNRGKRKNHSKESHRLINAILNLDLTYFEKKDAAFLKRWDCLDMLVELAMYSNPKENLDPSTEFQLRVLKIVQHVLGEVGFDAISFWFIFECCSQQMDFLIISLLELGNSQVYDKVREGIAYYGCLLDEHRIKKVELTLRFLDLAKHAAREL